MEDRVKGVPNRLYFFGLLPGLALLPRRLGYSLAKLCGRLIFETQAVPRNGILQSLAQVDSLLPSQHSAHEDITRVWFENLVCEDLDAFYYRFWSQENLEKYFVFEGTEHLDSALNEDRGVFLLTGHVGAVCAALVALSLRGYPITHVSRDYLSDCSISPAFRGYALYKIGQIEAKLGKPLINAYTGNSAPSHEAVLQIYQAIRNNQLVSMAVDVNPNWVEDCLTVRFLGRKSRFASNLVRLAQHCRSPIIPFFTVRNRKKSYQHRIIIRPRIEPTHDVQRDLQRCIDELSNTILAHPEQWFSWDSLNHFWI